MRNFLIFLSFIALLASCNKENSGEEDQSTINLRSSNADFMQLLSAVSPPQSDPFQLNSITVEGETVKIAVSYSGGCRKHTFDVIWSERLTETTPASTDLLLLHEDNGDMCEAYITDTLRFSVPDLVDTLSFDTLFVNVINGWDTGDSTSAGGYDPDTDTDNNGVVFVQGDVCQVTVTAVNVICGTGLWNNLWFALDDTAGADVDGYYFRKYLQPVAGCSCMTSFVPVAGKRYLVGARIQNEHPYLGVPVCLAYSGPSVPVRITCIRELN